MLGWPANENIHTSYTTLLENTYFLKSPTEETNTTVVRISVYDEGKRESALFIWSVERANEPKALIFFRTT